MTTTMPIFKRVPFIAAWVSSDKLDIKAIYRRPRYARGEYDAIERVIDEKTGLPAWDLTSGLPVRRHFDWIKKGFEYVTLADRDSLGQAARSLRDIGLNPHDFDQHPELGPWNPKLYLATVAADDKAAFTDLEQLVYEVGADTVLKVKRTAEPAFELPPQLRGIQAGSPLPSARAAAPTTTESPTTTLSDAVRTAVRKRRKAQPAGSAQS